MSVCLGKDVNNIELYEDDIVEVLHDPHRGELMPVSGYFRGKLILGDPFDRHIEIEPAHLRLQTRAALAPIMLTQQKGETASWQE